MSLVSPHGMAQALAGVDVDGAAGSVLASTGSRPEGQGGDTRTGSSRARLPEARRLHGVEAAPVPAAGLLYLMMLAAAFRSWVRSSGSCMTSSRKPITLHLSSSLVSKSCRVRWWLWLLC